MSNSITVKVLRDFDGLGNQATIVEVIERNSIRRGGYTGRGGHREWTERYNVINYKGKQHKIFGLPACYNDLAGACISVK